MSIQSRLLWLTLLAILLPAALQAARFVQERERAIEADAARLSVIALRRAEVVRDRVQGTSQLLFGLARASDLSTQDRAECSRFLSRVRDEYPQYTGLLTILPNGRLFCDSLQSGRDLDLRDRAYFQDAVATQSGVVLEPAFGRLSNMAVLQVAHPVRSPDGQLKFILLASLNLAKLLDLQAFALPDTRLLLLDRTGRVMATSRTDAARETIGASLVGTAVHAYASEAASSVRELAGPDGELAIWAQAESAILAPAGLSLLASVPKKSLVAAANKRFVQDFSVLTVAAALIFGAVWLLIQKSIRKPIHQVSTMAGRLAAGDLSARIAQPLPSGELGEFMAVLNQTADALEHQRQDIAGLNERLRRSQRLEAVGQLTGGLAHDFNNLLTVVIGNAELLTELNADRPEQRQLAEMIGQAAHRGAELTQRLLAFSRKQALDPKPVDMNQMLAGMDRLLRRSLGEQVEVELIRAAGLWLAVVDPGQLENALLNLALNARDAMPDGGKLTLETANVRLDAEYAGRHLEVAAGQYVMLAVTDSGEGIAQDNLARVFEPFFTTKEAGRGTGLGLAMVWGFVKQSGGHISLYSEPGQGTTARLYLPRSNSDGAAPAQPEAPTSPAGGHETILLVEDDTAVRAYAATQLRMLGYTVVEADRGKAALEMLDAGATVDLLFTDVVMPGGMNGRMLVEAALQKRPGLRVLYTSGYTENAVVHHGRLDPGALLLAKPYRRHELDRMVRLALNAHSPAPS